MTRLDTFPGLHPQSGDKVLLCKTELIPHHGLDDVELATLKWVDGHNHRRLRSAYHDLTRGIRTDPLRSTPTTHRLNFNNLSLRTCRGDSGSHLPGSPFCFSLEFLEGVV